MNVKRKTTEQIVQDILFEHPEWTGPQVYERYKIIVDPSIAVTKNAVEKHVKKIKDKMAEVAKKGLDQKWSLDKTPDFSADAIAAIFRLLNDKHGYPISVRQAIWISRLYATMPIISENRPLDLWLVSHIYAIAELHAEYTGDKNFNTDDLDHVLANGIEYFARYSHQIEHKYLSLFGEVTYYDHDEKDGE